MRPVARLTVLALVAAAILAPGGPAQADVGETVLTGPIIFLHGIDVFHGDGIASGTAQWDEARDAFNAWTGDPTFDTRNIESWLYYVCDRWPTRGRWSDISGYPSDTPDRHAVHFGSEGHETVECSDGSERHGHTEDAYIEHLGYHLAWALNDRFTAADGYCTTSVKVIAHSMGGVIARYAFGMVAAKIMGDPVEGTLDFPDRLCVSDVVTFGTPFKGTPVANGTSCSLIASQRHGGNAGQCWQLRENSGFIRKLGGLPNPERIGQEWTLVGSAGRGDYNNIPGVADCYRCDDWVEAESAVGVEAKHKVIYPLTPDQDIDHFGNESYYRLTEDGPTATVCFWDRADASSPAPPPDEPRDCPPDAPERGWHRTTTGFWPVRWAFHSLLLGYWGCGTFEQPWPIKPGVPIRGLAESKVCYFVARAPAAQPLAAGIVGNRDSGWSMVLKGDDPVTHAHICGETAVNGAAGCQIDDAPEGRWVVYTSRGHSGVSLEFTLTLDAAGERDCGSARDAGDAHATAQSITVPVTACVGRLAPEMGDPEDWFAFRAAAGDWLSVTLAPHAGDHDLCLYRPDAPSVAVACSRRSGAQSESVVFRADAAGDWRARLEARSIGGGYSFSAATGLGPLPQTLGTIPVGARTTDVVVDSGARRAYIGSLYDGVTVLDTRTDTVIARLTALGGVGALALDPVRQRLYVVAGGSGSTGVRVLDARSFGDIGYIVTDAVVTNVAVNPSANRVYVLDSTISRLYVADGATFGVTAVVSVPVESRHLAVNERTGRVYLLAHWGVEVLDGATNGSVAHIDIPGATSGRDITVHADTDRIFAATMPARISVIDGARNQIATSIDMNAFGAEPEAIDVNGSGGRLYSADWSGKSLSVVDVASGGLVGIVPAEWSLSGVGVDRELGKVYTAGVVDVSTSWVTVLRDDSTPPETSISSAPGASQSGAPTTSASAGGSFAFSAADNETPGSEIRFECRLDGEEFAPCVSPVTYAGLIPGEHLFQVRAADRSGNVDQTPARAAWSVEWAAPYSRLLTPDGAILVNLPGLVTQTVDGTAAAEAGIAQVSVLFSPADEDLDGGWQRASVTCAAGSSECSWTAVPPTTPGEYLVYVETVDAAGAYERLGAERARIVVI